MKNEYDIIIVGGGLGGLSFAALIAAQCPALHIACVDMITPQKALSQVHDARTTAISFGSHMILDRAGVWNDMAAKACPINIIHILDGARDKNFLEFDTAEVGDKPFGWILDNADIRRALYKKIDRLENIDLIAPFCVRHLNNEAQDKVAITLDSGRMLTARLLVGADGRNSYVREALGMGARRWSYDQDAVICTAIHENPHNNIAVEHFRKEGPFAILPMCDDEKGRHRSSVVWTEHGGSKKSALHWSVQSFNAGLRARFPDFYGHVELTGKPAGYPLGLVHAHCYTDKRTALLADAAHGIHPIAGQGLNLGFRDIGTLADLITEAERSGNDIGGQDVLNMYERARRGDNMAMAGATDSLNRLFSNNSYLAGFLRQNGMRIIDKLPPAKRFFMTQAMGLRTK